MKARGTGFLVTLRETVRTGPVSIEPYQIQSFYRWRLKREGLRLRTKKADGEILAWVERA